MNRIGWVFALIAFAAGSLSATALLQARAEAAGSRVFQLMIYHAKPGRRGALEAIFRDVSKLQAAHHLDVLGYWTPTEDPQWKDTLIYVVAHASREAADANWQALHADPAFLPYRKAAEPLIERTGDDFNVDEIYMRPTDFSALR